MCDLPHVIMETEPNDSFLDDLLIMISTTYPCYGYLIIYIQTHRFHPDLSCDDHRSIRHHAKYYLILNDTLYWHGIDSILRQCLTHEEVGQVLNDCHYGACSSHFFGMATTHKILRAGYFWPSIFKDFHEVVKKFPPCQFFIPKSVPTLICYTLSFSLALSPNGGWISCIVILPQLGAWLHHSSYLLFHEMG